MDLLGQAGMDACSDVSTVCAWVLFPAGVRKGDRVLLIDGLPAESLTLDETITLLRGPVGSTVSLVVAPAGSSMAGSRPPRVLELERRTLPQPALREAHLPLADGRFVQYV